MSENRSKSDAYMLRLPDGMRDQIKAAAEANARSMNAEIVARLSGAQANLRDQIAMEALAAFVTTKIGLSARSTAILCCELADAMLAERAKAKEGGA